MILDHETMFSSDQKITATAASTGIVDLGPGDAGASERLSLFVNVGNAFSGTGTMTVELRTADALNAAGDALESGEILATYPVSNSALKRAGKLVCTRLPHGMKRYATLTYTVDGSLSAGMVTSGLVMDVQSW